MGRILDIGVDTAYDHEGYVDHILADGTMAGGTSRTTSPTTDQLKAACSCGWFGDHVWDNDNRRVSWSPGEDLENRILAAWETPVHGVLGQDRDRDLAYLRQLVERLGHQDVDEDNLNDLQANFASGLAAVQRVRRNPGR